MVLYLGSSGAENFLKHKWNPKNKKLGKTGVLFSPTIFELFQALNFKI